MREYYIKETQYTKSRITDFQIDEMSDWVKSFVDVNRHELENLGIRPRSIYDRYKVNVKFPVGPKAFAPMLHLYGMEKIHKNKGSVYIIYKKESVCQTN